MSIESYNPCIGAFKSVVIAPKIVVFSFANSSYVFGIATGFEIAPLVN